MKHADLPAWKTRRDGRLAVVCSPNKIPCAREPLPSLFVGGLVPLIVPTTTDGIGSTILIGSLHVAGYFENRRGAVQQSCLQIRSDTSFNSDPKYTQPHSSNAQLMYEPTNVRILTAATRKPKPSFVRDVQSSRVPLLPEEISVTIPVLRLFSVGGYFRLFAPLPTLLTDFACRPVCVCPCRHRSMTACSASIVQLR